MRKTLTVTGEIIAALFFLAFDASRFAVVKTFEFLVDLDWLEFLAKTGAAALVVLLINVAVWATVASVQLVKHPETMNQCVIDCAKEPR